MYQCFHTAGSTSSAAQCNAARFSLQCVQLAASGYRWKTRLALAWITKGPEPEMGAHGRVTKGPEPEINAHKLL